MRRILPYLAASCFLLVVALLAFPQAAFSADAPPETTLEKEAPFSFFELPWEEGNSRETVLRCTWRCQNGTTGTQDVDSVQECQDLCEDNCGNPCRRVDE